MIRLVYFDSVNEDYGENFIVIPENTVDIPSSDIILDKDCMEILESIVDPDIERV